MFFFVFFKFHSYSLDLWYLLPGLGSHITFIILLLWKRLSRDGNLHGLGVSHGMTASTEPLFKAPWRVGDAVVSSGNTGPTTSKTGHPSPSQNCWQWPPAEKTGRRFLLNHLWCPLPNDPIGQGTEMNWTTIEWSQMPLGFWCRGALRCH